MQAKGWTAVVVLTLAIGVGANAAIFSAVNGMLLRKLAVHDPHSLVRLRTAGRNDMATDSSDYGFTPEILGPVRTTFSYAMYQHFRDANTTMVDLVGSVPVGRMTAMVDRRAETVTGMLVTGNFFQLLGVNARVGRPIEPGDDNAAAAPVAMLSSGTGVRDSRLTRGSSGASSRSRSVPVTIIGVTPAEFTGTQRPLAEPRDVTLPLALDPGLRSEDRLNGPTNWFVQIMGRLKPGATVEEVQSNLGGVFGRQARAGMDAYLAGLPDQSGAIRKSKSYPRAHACRRERQPGNLRRDY